MKNAPVIQCIAPYGCGQVSFAWGLRSSFVDIAECKIPKEMQLETAYNTIGGTRVQIGLEMRAGYKNNQKCSRLRDAST
jgi:hypothetical protein